MKIRRFGSLLLVLLLSVSLTACGTPAPAPQESESTTTTTTTAEVETTTTTATTAETTTTSTEAATSTKTPTTTKITKSTTKKSTTTAKRTTTKWENWPDISAFSNKKYENYKKQFPSVKSAVYNTFENEVEVEIAKNDPRLIRLLNFIAYGENEGYTKTRTQPVDSEWLSRMEDNPKLKVTFANDGKGGSRVGKCREIWINDDYSCLDVDPDTRTAEWVYPYGIQSELDMLTMVGIPTLEEVDPHAPSKDKRKISVFFDGKRHTMDFYKTVFDEETGRMQWTYHAEMSRNVPTCKIDVESGRIVSIYQNVKLSIGAVLTESEVRSFFKQRFSESGLSSSYLNKAEYTIKTTSMGAPSAKVTIQLNEAGDTVHWGVCKTAGTWLSSAYLELAEPGVFPKELDDFYNFKYVG